MGKKLKKLLAGLYRKIVGENASPEYIARGWAIGMFFGCLIPIGLQLFCSIPTALLLRGSKIGAVFGTFLTNYFTIVLIYPLQCYLGNRIIGGTLSYRAIELALDDLIREKSFAAFRRIGPEFLEAFFIGGAVLALTLTPATYFLIRRLAAGYQKRKIRRSGDTRH